MKLHSSTTISKASSRREFAPVTPGEMLKEEFLAEYGLTQSQLAKAIRRKGRDRNVGQGHGLIGGETNPGIRRSLPAWKRGHPWKGGHPASIMATT